MLANNNYMKLLRTFPPRPITSDEKLEATQAVIDSLLDRPSLTHEEQDYLNVLGTLVSEYEQNHESIPDLYGVELLKVLLTERGLRQKDLIMIFKTESIVSDIFNGKRQLTTRHIQELADFFHLSPAVFFPRHPVQKFSLD